MNTKAIRQLADVTLDKYRSSIPRKAFKEFVKDIIAGENRATAFRYEASPICAGETLPNIQASQKARPQRTKGATP